MTVEHLMHPIRLPEHFTPEVAPFMQSEPINWNPPHYTGTPCTGTAAGTTLSFDSGSGANATTITAVTISDCTTGAIYQPWYTPAGFATTATITTSGYVSTHGWTPTDSVTSGYVSTHIGTITDSVDATWARLTKEHDDRLVNDITQKILDNIAKAYGIPTDMMSGKVPAPTKAVERGSEVQTLPGQQLRAPWSFEQASSIFGFVPQENDTSHLPKFAG